MAEARDTRPVPPPGGGGTGRVPEVRLAETALVALDEDRILIANPQTGAHGFWPRAQEDRLNRYLDWRRLPDILATAVEDAPATAGESDDGVNGELETLAELIRIGALDERSRDLCGERLPAPGPAWEPAMRFLAATRTQRDTIFALPEAYNALLAEKARLHRQPSAYYERVGAKVLPLSDPTAGRKGRAVRFEDVLLRRRTARRFAETPMSEAQLSALLYYSWGETGSVPNPLGDVFLRKTSPSGGSLHPVEVYAAVMNVEGIEPGLYHYSVRRHALEEIRLEDPRAWISAASGDQEWVAEAGVVFLCTAFLPRTAWKYNYPRVARAVIAEIGYTGQSAFLTATWLGLGAFTTMALRDEIWEEKLGLDPDREPVLSITGAGQLETELKDHARPRKESAPGVDRS